MKPVKWICVVIVVVIVVVVVELLVLAVLLQSLEDICGWFTSLFTDDDGDLGDVIQMNPGISYVQGMNEILAPLFLVFYQDNQVRRTTYCL